MHSYILESMKFVTYTCNVFFKSIFKMKENKSFFCYFNCFMLYDCFKGNAVLCPFLQVVHLIVILWKAMTITSTAIKRWAITAAMSLYEIAMTTNSNNKF